MTSTVPNSPKGATVRLSLGALVDPSCFTEPLDISGQDETFLRESLHMMLLIRIAEEVIAGLVEDGSANTPCHLGIGQEAVAVGVSAHLTGDDRVFGAHRSHAHYLALGSDVYALLAEVLGKADGASRGMGGSMHLFAGANGFYGSVPIVGATISLAVGAALAAKMDGSSAVGVCYFGDGTSEEGVFHEALNLAAIRKLPVFFVCENNLYSSHLDIKLRQPFDSIARFAAVHGLPARTVDGNDVLAVAGAAEELLAHARSGAGPVFLEGVTYRWRGHVGPDENIDVGVRRRKADVDAWKRRDPIRRLSDAMISAGMITTTNYQELAATVRDQVVKAAKKAKKAPYPDSSQLLDLVYPKD